MNWILEFLLISGGTLFICILTTLIIRFLSGDLEPFFRRFRKNRKRTTSLKEEIQELKKAVEDNEKALKKLKITADDMGKIIKARERGRP